MEVNDDLSVPQGRGPWDRVVDELHALKNRVSDPSYGEIARRIEERRTAAGTSEHAAHLARSTVHDAFRRGRARLNLPLMREIVEALGGDAALVDEWIAAPLGTSANDSPPRDLDPVPQAVEPPSPPSRRDVVLLLAACVALNMLGRALVDFLNLPIYLDMVGTAIAAIVLGPWRGALVGGTTNVVAVIGSGVVSLPFALVNIAGALVWGYGVRFGMGKTLARFFSLNLLVAVVCTLVAVPILVLVYGGSVGQGQDTITDTFLELTDQLAVAVGLSNILTSSGDKLISGFVALVAVSSMPLALRSGSKLVLVESRQ